MNIMSWFKPKNKHNVVIPSTAVGPLRGVELIRAFSTEDEPKAADFPKMKYSAYWETFIDAIPGGYAAVVRFYSYKTGPLFEQTFNCQSVSELRQEVTKLILKTMEEKKV
jgi:hypothetical protein